MDSPRGPSRTIPLSLAPIARDGSPGPTELARPLAANRRQFQRVTLVHGPAIRVEIWRPDGRKLVGVVEDCCWSGASVRFVMGSDPRIQVDQVGVVVVTSLRLPDVQLRARVASAQPLANGGMRYGLQFLDEEELRRQITPEWRRWFSRRRKPRFAPREELAARVSLTWRGGSTLSRVLDASIDGLGVEVDLEPARSIVLAREVALLLSFPGSHGPLRLHAAVRGSKQGPRGVRLGLEYLPDDLLESAKPRIEAWLERLRARDGAVAGPWSTR